MQRLTGGMLVARDKEYIVFFRGKDFLPPGVASALLERQERALMNADVEEQMRLLAGARVQGLAEAAGAGIPPPHGWMDGWMETLGPIIGQVAGERSGRVDFARLGSGSVVLRYPFCGFEVLRF